MLFSIYDRETLFINKGCSLSLDGGIYFPLTKGGIHSLSLDGGIHSPLRNGGIRFFIIVE